MNDWNYDESCMGYITSSLGLKILGTRFLLHMIQLLYLVPYL